MKLKYYLRGLGIGIICTAIIMGIALSGGKSQTLSNDEIIERARLLGMVMAEDSTENKKTQEVKSEDTTDSKKNESQGSDTTIKQPPKSENQVPEQKDETVTPPTVETASGTNTELKTIEILPGEYSDVISQKLMDAGLIPDAVAFNVHLMDIGADNQIQVGVHKIPTNAVQEDIIKILCEKPN